jgi:indole-3-glycerol phosphate synthase
MKEDFLVTIVRAKHEEVARAKIAVPVEQLKETIGTLGRPRNFFHAVTRDPKTHVPAKPVNLIAEIKKASPSAGVIRADFDPVSIARNYAAAGADALSVLTDQKWFQGKLEYVQAVRDAVKLPVLRKDFIVDPYQVYESRAAGADAILLIAECLRTNEMIDLQILATELNLTCLIEVHDIDSLMRVRDQVIGFPHRSYSLLGINNRDLRTMTTDLKTTSRMAELVEDKSVLVSESGIKTFADVKKVADAGVRAILVGESLMKSPDEGAALKALMTGT